MKIISTLCLIVLMMTIAPAVQGAEKEFMLYGFKIGQEKKTALETLGTPFKVHKFTDGYISTAYRMKDHFLIIQSNNIRPDLIWAIQIQGKSNPPFHGLGPVNLGDPVEKVIKTYGKPDSIKKATDEVTKKEIPGISYYSYYQRLNFSIEIREGKVSSIKAIFNGPRKDNDRHLSIGEFVQTVQSKDLNRIGRLICTRFQVYGKKPYSLKGSILTSLEDPRGLKDIFFNEEYGIITIKPKDITYSAMRVDGEDREVGYVYRVKRKNKVYELFLIRSYDGWVLRYINFLAQ